MQSTSLKIWKLGVEWEIDVWYYYDDDGVAEIDDARISGYYLNGKLVHLDIEIDVGELSDEFDKIIDHISNLWNDEPDYE